MIVKQCQFAGRDDTGEHIHLLHPGYDNFELMKTASEEVSPPQLERVRALMRDLPRETGRLYALISALGASEYWGSNSNADDFDTEALVRVPPGWWELPYEQQVQLGKRWEWGFPTFYNAHLFAHHCFVGGTPIVMGDRTRIPIDRVRAGDLVATRTGPKKVTRTTSRKYVGVGTALTLQGVDTPLVGTPDHPVLVLRRKQVHCRHKYNKLAASEHLAQCVQAREPIGAPQWVPLGEVQLGDYLLTPGPITGIETLEPEFAELVGWVAADGYLGKRGTIQFSFSSTGEKLTLVEQCLRRNKLHVGVTPRLQYGVTMLSACSAALSKRVRCYVVGTTSEKRLTAEVLKWDVEARLQLIGAYSDGDGCVTPAELPNRGQLRIRSASSQMLFLLADLARSLGVAGSINWDSPSGPMISPTNGKQYWGGPSGCLAVGASGAADLLKTCQRLKPVAPYRNCRVYPFEGSMFLVKVVDSDPVELNENVFNLEVEDEHEYIANEVVVHNCNKDPNRAFGDIIHSDWDSRMHRVLLVGAFDHDRARRFGGQSAVERLENGEYLSVSMGTKVPFDLCSYCVDYARVLPLRPHPQQILAEHRQNPIRGLNVTIRDYCEHLRREKNHIYPNGVRVSMLNWHPRFFDLSCVFVGADKTSFVLAKLAHECPIRPGVKECGNCPHEECVPSAHVHEVWSRDMQKTASPTVDLLAQRLQEARAKTATANKSAFDKQSEIYKDVPPNVGQVLAPVTDAEPDLPEEVVREMAQDPENTLASGLSMGVIAKPHEFQRVMLHSTRRGDLAEDLEQRGLTFRTGAPPEGFCLGRELLPRILELLLPLVAARSMLSRPLAKRIIATGGRTGDMIHLHLRADADTPDAALEMAFQKWLGARREANRTRTALEDPLMDKLSAAYSAYRRDAVYAAPELLRRGLLEHTKLAEALCDSDLYTPGLAKTAGDVLELVGMASVAYLNGAYLKEPASQYVATHCNLSGLEKAAGLARLSGVA